METRRLPRHIAVAVIGRWDNQFQLDQLFWVNSSRIGEFALGSEY